MKPHIKSALENFGTTPDEAFVRRPVVAALFGVTELTTRRWEEKGTLPKHVLVGGVGLFVVGQVRRSMRAAKGVAQ